MRRRHLLLPCLVPPALAAGHWALRVPEPPFHEPLAQPFNDELLIAALERLGDRVSLRRSPPQTWARQIRELEQGLVDVAPLPALDGAYQGRRLLRVDFPLRPGLLGLRLLLARQDRVAELGRLGSLEQLRRVARIGYGADWADRERMEQLGFQLVLARSTEGLYELLRSGRCDLLSRGFKEVEPELQRFGKGAPALAVLPDVALHYPLDDCFFVAPQQQALHAALGEGLQRLRRDGGWLQLLRRHYGPLLRRLAMARRQIWPLPGYPAPGGLEPELLDPRPWLARLA